MLNLNLLVILIKIIVLFLVEWKFDVIGGHVTSKLFKILCKSFLFSSKNIRQHFFLKYVKTKLIFGPNGRKNHKIYHRVRRNNAYKNE